MADGILGVAVLALLWFLTHLKSKPRVYKDEVVSAHLINGNWVFKTEERQPKRLAVKA